MILSRHPITAAMFMIVSMLGVAALFVLLDAFFLAVLQVLVYAGAVMVLFCLSLCCSMLDLRVLNLLDLPGCLRLGWCCRYFSSWSSFLILST